MKKIALVFPGQGSQSVGMLAELAAQNPIVHDTFAQASAVLGYDLWRLTEAGPEEQLNQTEYAQPALLTAGYAVWQVWQQKGGALPSYLAGHSLGEYTALVCAEALSFEDGVKLVAERGRIMQEAVPVGKGAMVALVGLNEEKVLSICKEAAQGQILEPANYNSLGQIVLAGEMDAAKRAVELAKTAGAKIAKLLVVSVPSHCALMKGAAEQFKERLDLLAIQAPRIPVINNVDVAAYQDPAEIKNALIRQIYNPVRWVETIQLMKSQGVEVILECGPGKVLTGLNKRIVTDVAVDFIGLSQNLSKYL